MAKRTSSMSLETESFLPSQYYCRSIYIYRLFFTPFFSPANFHTLIIIISNHRQIEFYISNNSRNTNSFFLKFSLILVNYYYILHFQLFVNIFCGKIFFFPILSSRFQRCIDNIPKRVRNDFFFFFFLSLSFFFQPSCSHFQSKIENR